MTTMKQIGGSKSMKKKKAAEGSEAIRVVEEYDKLPKRVRELARKTLAYANRRRGK
jgi:hypothetical protein